MSNTTNGLMIGDQEIVATKEKPKNGYGQNGYQGPASDLPGQHTRIEGLSTPAVVPGRTSDGTPDWQTRKVSAAPFATAHGHRDRGSENVKISGALHYGK